MIDISSLQPIFFNVVFADPDVSPFDLELTYGNSSGGRVIITPHNNTAGENGLIQASFAELASGDVFSDGGVWNGFLDATFVAPNEPYTAYDFVGLSTVPFNTNVPEPGSLALLFLAQMALVPTKRHLRRAG